MLLRVSLEGRRDSNRIGAGILPRGEVRVFVAAEKCGYMVQIVTGSSPSRPGPPA